MRNEPEQLTASHISWALKPLRQSSDLRLYERLFAEAQLAGNYKNFFQGCNHDSLNMEMADPESLSDQLGQGVQLERHSFIVTDHADQGVGGKLAVNLVMS